MHQGKQAGMRFLSEQRKEKHSEWGAWGPTQHLQEMEGSWAALNSQAGQCRWAGDCWLVQRFRDWACRVQEVPGVFKESFWKESCSYNPGYEIIRGIWWAILSGQLDRRRKKAKGLVHWRRKIKFSGLVQQQGSSRLSVTSSVCQRGKKK